MPDYINITVSIGLTYRVKDGELIDVKFDKADDVSRLTFLQKLIDDLDYYLFIEKQKETRGGDS